MDVKQEKLADEKMSHKQFKNMKIESRVLDPLSTLKKVNGPFTRSADVKLYIDNPDIPAKEKSKRMKMEVQYARDTSLSLPKGSSVFAIMKKKEDGTGNRQLTSDEFAQNVIRLLEKKESVKDKKVTIDNFLSCILQFLYRYCRKYV